MKSFEEKREEYFNEMKSDSDFIMSVMATKDNQDQKTMEVLFTPKNDQELEIAKVLYRYISDSIRVTLRALEGAYEEDTEWNPKESPYFNLYEGLIKGLMKTGEIDKSLIDPACHYRGRESALLTYDMLTGFVSHVDEAYETLAEDCGIDFDDDFSAIQFKLLDGPSLLFENRLKAILTKKNFEFKDDENLDEQLVDAVAFAIQRSRKNVD